jgi:hypothetical protein
VGLGAHIGVRHSWRGRAAELVAASPSGRKGSNTNQRIRERSLSVIPRGTQGSGHLPRNHRVSAAASPFLVGPCPCPRCAASRLGLRTKPVADPSGDTRKLRRRRGPHERVGRRLDPMLAQGTPGGTVPTAIARAKCSLRTAIATRWSRNRIRLGNQDTLRTKGAQYG